MQLANGNAWPPCNLHSSARRPRAQPPLENHFQPGVPRSGAAWQLQAEAVMKMRSCAPWLCLVGVLSGGLLRAAAEMEAVPGITIESIADFTAPMADQGAWLQAGDLRGWRPAGVTAEWRPYCHGSWVWTDCGWYWVSDEPWGWAAYHYGAWVDDANHGWLWVPGVEWAPAWVNWRVGADDIAWAPQGPNGQVAVPTAYVSVTASRFLDPVRPDTVTNNPEQLARTVEITNSLTREQRLVDGVTREIFFNHGPDVAMVEQATGRRLTPVPVAQAEPAYYSNSSAATTAGGLSLTVSSPPNDLSHFVSKPSFHLPQDPGGGQLPQLIPDSKAGLPYHYHPGLSPPLPVTPSPTNP